MVTPVKVPTHKYKNKETKLDAPCEFTFQWLWYVAGFISGILLSIVFVVNH